MGTLDDTREGIRLARLNNQSYRFMFGVFDFVKGLLKLSLLGCFAVGIWYLTYGYETIGAAAPEPESAAANAVPDAPDNETALSEAQIAKLRSFAQRHRDSVAPVENTPRASRDEGAVAMTRAASVAEATDSGQPAMIDQPAEVPGSADNVLLVTPGASLAPTITTEAELPLPDFSAKTLLAELEQKLGGGQAQVTEAGVLDNASSVLAPPVIQASTSPPSSAVEATPELAAVESTEGGAEASVAESGAAVTVVEAETEINMQEVQAEGWVLEQNPEHFVIQIGSTTNYPFLVRFEKQLPDSQPTAIFEMLIGQTAEHTLTYGSFDTRQAATAALGALSQRARRYGAYVRKISAVQQQIRDLGDDLAVAQTASGQVVVQ